MMESDDVVTSVEIEASDSQFTAKRQISLILGRPTLQRTQTSDLLRINVDQTASERKKEESKNKQKIESNGHSRLSSARSKKSANRHSKGRQSKTEEPIEIDSDEDTPWKDDTEKPNLSYIPVKKKDDDLDIAKEPTYDSSDFYDTDLETDGTRDETPLDTAGIRTYKRLCRRLRISTVGAVLTGLKSDSVSVKGRGMDAVDALALSSALLENTQVTSLNLDDNQLGPRGVEFVSLMLFENYYITELSVADNKLGSRGCALVMEMLLENTTIKTLNLSGNTLGDAEAELVAHILYNNLSITSVNLSHNDISDEGASALGKAIADNEFLRNLDLSWNKIRPNGGIAFCEGLQENVVLNTVSLAYNGLSVRGAKAMGEAMEINETLRHLDLTCNRMFDEGVTYLARALMTNEKLHTLRISNNAMTTASVLTLLNSVKGNPDSALTLLDMSSMHVYKDALRVTEEIKFMRPHFNFLFGGVVNSDDTQSAGSVAMMSQRNPMTLLREFMLDRNLRISDLFKQLDKDGSGSVSREEFVLGLKSLNVPMTNAQIDRLIQFLDKDGDGEIDFAEMMSGDREHKRRQMKLKQAAIAKMKRLKKEKQMAKLKAQQAAEAKAQQTAEIKARQAAEAKAKRDAERAS